MPALLIFGHDDSLLDTRATLLRTRGYTVYPVTRLSDILGVDDAVGLLILCHTLGEQDCASALELATRRWPGVHSIALVSSGKAPCSLKIPTVHSWEGPAKLLAAVEHNLDPTRTRAEAD